VNKLFYITCLFLVSCGTFEGNRERNATILGATTGALVGSAFGGGSGRVFTTAIGGVAGGLAGNSIGRKMDAKDLELANNNAYVVLTSMPDNASRSWENSANKHSGSFTATSTTEMKNENKVCRQYVQTVTIDSRKVESNGKACRYFSDTSNSWIVEQ